MGSQGQIARQTMRTQLETMSRAEAASAHSFSRLSRANLANVKLGALKGRPFVVTRTPYTYERISLRCLRNYQKTTPAQATESRRIMLQLVLVRRPLRSRVPSIGDVHKRVYITAANVARRKDRDVLIGGTQAADSVVAASETAGLRQDRHPATLQWLCCFLHLKNVLGSVYCPTKSCRPFQTGRQAFSAKTEWPGHTETHWLHEASLRRIPWN